MEKKNSKGLFKFLFAPKSNSGCCNVQFEEVFGPEIINKKELTEKQGKDNSENKKEENKDSSKSK